MPSSSFLKILCLVFFLGSLILVPEWNIKTVDAHNKKINVPYKSFVKVFKHAEIVECLKKDDSCPKGAILTATGSGTAIDMSDKINQSLPGSLILTAGHMCDWNNSRLASEVTKISKKVTVVDYAGVRHEVLILSFVEDKKLDLCLLFAPNLIIPSVKLSKNAPKIGDDVFAMAAPAGIYHPPVVPIFKGTYSGNVNNYYSLTTIPALGGSSGAAILDHKSKIVGVLFAVARDFNHISLVTNYDQTMKFINEQISALNVLSNNSTQKK